jgi:hypothetical protein
MELIPHSGSGRITAEQRPTRRQVKPYEFGLEAGLLPNYVRAVAYLRLLRSEEAAAEFSAILDHRGVSPLAPWVLSHLGLARAYSLKGDTVKAWRCLSGLPCALKRRRPRHPHPEASQSRVLEVEIAHAGFPRSALKWVLLEAL